MSSGLEIVLSDQGAQIDLQRIEASLRAGIFLRSFLQLAQPAATEVTPSTEVEMIVTEPTVALHPERQATVSPPLGRTAVPAKTVEYLPAGLPKPKPATPKTAKPVKFVGPITPRRQVKSALNGVLPGFEDMGPGDWTAAALCSQTDPELFFPEKGGSTKMAKQICESCSVKVECLEYAIEHDERFGVWGGYSERERRRIKRGQKLELSEHKLASSLIRIPYSRVKFLVDTLESEDGVDREAIEDGLHEEPARLTKFVQAMLSDYELTGNTALKPTKGTLRRLFDYFVGEQVWKICKTPSVEARLAREIQALENFIDERLEDGIDLLDKYWTRSTLNGDSPLGVLNHIEAKPKWVKDAMLARRRDTV